MATPDTTLRIALTGYRSHPHVGGQGIYLRHLAMALTKLGHRVDVISGPPYPELPDSIRLVKLPSLNLYEAPNHVTALRPKHLRSYSDTYEWWSMLTGGFAEPYTFGRRLTRYLKQHGDQYDIIHDNQSLCYGLLDIEQPVLETIHHPITRDREQAIAAAKNWLHRWGTKRWYSFLKMQEKVARKLPAVVTVSDSSRQDIEQCFGRAVKHTHVVFNGIDTDRFTPLKGRAKKPLSVVTTASSDQPVKGFAVLAKAIAALKHSLPDISVTVIGQLKQGGANEKLVEKLGLGNTIEFRSGLTEQEMVEAYNNTSIYVCPSLYEGFGLPVAEAMSCGTAVVSSDGGALPEVLGDCGLSAPAGDEQALANGILTLLTDDKLRKHYEQQGRQRAEQTFCWTRVAENYVATYRETITQYTLEHAS